jgi:phosphohistidine phosphatase
VQEDALYLAAAADILKVVRGTGPRVAHLMVVTHNPGVSELMEQLAEKSAAEGLGTAAVCSMTFETSDWSAVGRAAVASVLHESPPRKLFGIFN